MVTAKDGPIKFLPRTYKDGSGRVFRKLDPGEYARLKASPGFKAEFDAEHEGWCLEQLWQEADQPTAGEATTEQGLALEVRKEEGQRFNPSVSRGFSLKRRLSLSLAYHTCGTHGSVQPTDMCTVNACCVLLADADCDSRSHVSCRGLRLFPSWWRAWRWQQQRPPNL